MKKFDLMTAVNQCFCKMYSFDVASFLFNSSFFSKKSVISVLVD